MLQILCFGVAFLLFGVGAIARLLKVLIVTVTPKQATSEFREKGEKPKPSTGMAEQIFYTALGLLILALAYFQGAALVEKMNGLGF